MNKEFVLKPEALALKELDFDEPCFKFYIETGELFPASYSKEGTVYPSNSDLLPEWTASPTYSQAFRWFRDNHSLVHRIDKEGGWWVCAILNLYDEKEQGTIEIYLENSYPNTYEEAELACLRKLIQIVKK